MDQESIFKLIFIIGVLAAYAVRMPYVKRRRRIASTESRITRLEGYFSILAFIGMQFVPIFYIATSWWPEAGHPVPLWAGGLGTVLFAAAVWILWRAHADLGMNWSASLQLREQHELVTGGIYASIRHPIYAAHWLWVIAQALLIPNWLVGFAGLATFPFIYFYRIPREEQMMLDRFGDAYREYLGRTGRVLPRLVN